jgi:hypothetical protein
MRKPEKSASKKLYYHFFRSFFNNSPDCMLEKIDLGCFYSDFVLETPLYQGSQLC